MSPADMRALTWEEYRAFRHVLDQQARQAAKSR